MTQSEKIDRLAELVMGCTKIRKVCLEPGDEKKFFWLREDGFKMDKSWNPYEHIAAALDVARKLANDHATIPEVRRLVINRVFMGIERNGYMVANSVAAAYIADAALEVAEKVLKTKESQ